MVRPTGRRALAFSAALAALFLLLAVVRTPAHAQIAPVSFLASSAATEVIVNGQPAAPGDVFCAVAAIGDTGICTTVSALGAFALTIDVGGPEFFGSVNIVLPDGSAVSSAFTVVAGAVFAFTAASPLVLTDFPFRAGVLVEDALIQVGQSTTVTLTLTNAGVPIAGATVLWSVQPAQSLVIPSPSSITDANGNASIVVTVLQEGDILVRGIVGSSLTLPGFQAVRGTGAITAVAEIEQVVDVPLTLGFNGYVGPNATAAALFDVSTFDIAWKLQDGEWIYYVPRRAVPGSLNCTLRSGDILFLSVLR